jgi:hypothetical protein
MTVTIDSDIFSALDAVIESIETPTDKPVGLRRLSAHQFRTIIEQATEMLSQGRAGNFDREPSSTPSPGRQ